MRAVNCNECGEAFEAETREEILKKLYDHYMQKHHAVITSATEEDKKVWMARFEREWASTEEK